MFREETALIALGSFLRCGPYKHEKEHFRAV